MDILPSRLSGFGASANIPLDPTESSRPVPGLLAAMGVLDVAQVVAGIGSTQSAENNIRGGRRSAAASLIGARAAASGVGAPDGSSGVMERPDSPVAGVVDNVSQPSTPRGITMTWTPDGGGRHQRAPWADLATDSTTRLVRTGDQSAPTASPTHNAAPRGWHPPTYIGQRPIPRSSRTVRRETPQTNPSSSDLLSSAPEDVTTRVANGASRLPSRPQFSPRDDSTRPDLNLSRAATVRPMGTGPGRHARVEDGHHRRRRSPLEMLKDGFSFLRRHEAGRHHSAR